MLTTWHSGWPSVNHDSFSVTCSTESQLTLEFSCCFPLGIYSVERIMSLLHLFTFQNVLQKRKKKKTTKTPLVIQVFSLPEVSVSKYSAQALSLFPSRHSHHISLVALSSFLRQFFLGRNFLSVFVFPPPKYLINFCVKLSRHQHYTLQIILVCR